MRISDLQTILTNAGHYTYTIDNIDGRRTRRAVEEFLRPAVGDKLDGWTEARRNVGVEQLHYKNEDLPVGPIDGLAGPQTAYARELYQAARRGELDKVLEWRDAKMGLDGESSQPVNISSSQWPTQSGVSSFYGSQNSDQVLLEMPFPLRLAWEPSTIVYRVSCHRKVASALKAIWEQTLEHYEEEGIRKLRFDMFGGCLNPRPMRGSRNPSMHSWGIAWDIDPERNQYKWGRDLAALDEADYDPFWQIVEGQGAISLGRSRNFDWMHFQFARLG